MATLTWDNIGTRSYEHGLDKGVLYLPDGSGVAWSGLTSVIEHFNETVVPVHFEGRKVNDLVSLGSFAATMKAVTYPDEFSDLEGIGSIRRGVKVGEQKHQAFG